MSLVTVSVVAAFAAYLWIVAWSLYLDCKDEAASVASAVVSMSALLEDGEENTAHCSVQYAILEKEN